MSTPAEKINAPAVKRQPRREWTAARKRAVVRYYAKHGSQAAQDKFRVSGSMLTRWRDESGGTVKKSSAKKRGKGSAPGSGRSPVKVPASSRARANGTALHDAIIYLEHAEAAARTTGKQWTNAELFALLALRVLRGEL